MADIDNLYIDPPENYEKQYVLKASELGEIFSKFYMKEVFVSNFTSSYSWIKNLKFSF